MRKTAALKPQIYTASKVWHAPKWRTLRDIGMNVKASWLDFPEGSLSVEQQVDLWTKCVEEATDADFVLLYAEPGDVMKGALIEAGCCLAAGGTVLQVGEGPSLMAGDGSDASFTQHPRWRRCADLAKALNIAGNL